MLLRLRIARIVAVATPIFSVAAGAAWCQPATAWAVRGEAVVTCPCKVPCPCRSNARPSQNHCENLSYVRVVQGNYGSTKLDGLEYLWAADECQAGPRSQKPTNLYFSRAVTAKQIAAVEDIMLGEHCAHTRNSGMKVKRVDLSAGAAGSVYSVRVPSIIQMDVDLAPGGMPMEPLPALDSWSNTVTYARNITARIDDPDAGLKWDYSGLQANYRTFEITSALVEKGLMLAMFRDDAGRFNAMQRSLIQEQHLEVPLSGEEFKSMLAQVREPAKTVSAGAGKDPWGAIGGMVYGADGKPRSGARIRMVATPPRAIPVAISNAMGRYFVARVAPGPYRLCAFTWDGRTAQRSCANVDVKVGIVERQDVKLEAMLTN
jgi:hypothetical protein